MSEQPGKSADKEYVCCFCDDRQTAPKKPMICLNCGEKNPYERINKPGKLYAGGKP